MGGSGGGANAVTGGGGGGYEDLLGGDAASSLFEIANNDELWTGRDPSFRGTGGRYDAEMLTPGVHGCGIVKGTFSRAWYFNCTKHYVCYSTGCFDNVRYLNS